MIIIVSFRDANLQIEQVDEARCQQIELHVVCQVPGPTNALMYVIKRNNKP